MTVLTRALLALWLLAGATFAQAPPAARPDIETLRKDMAQIEAQIQRDQLADSELDRLRARLEPILSTAREAIGRERPRLAEINERLARIGDKPKDGAPPESAEVAKNRAEQEAIKKEADETIRVAELLAVRAEQAQTAIADIRRRQFTREVLERADSIISPWLWTDVAIAIPSAVSDFAAFLAFRGRTTIANLDQFSLMSALALMAGLLVGYRPVRRLVLGVLDRWSGAPAAAPTRGERAFAALRGALLGVLLPLAVTVVVSLALRVIGLGADRLGGFFRTVLIAWPVLALLRGLLVGVLQPDKAAWRVAPVTQATAERLFNALWSIALIVFASKIVEAASHSIAAALPITVAAKGLAATLTAIILILALRKLEKRQDAEDQCLDAQFGPAVAPDANHALGLLLRAGGRLSGAAIIVSAVLGYVALASFLADQTLWLLTLGAVTGLLLIIIDEFLAKGLSRDGQASRRLRAATGLSPQTIQQIGILSSGLLRFLLYIAAGLLLLAPLGIDSDDLFGSLRAAIFGFQLGGVTISLSRIALSLGIFAGLLFTFGAIKGWVEDTYLPSTGLDAGLRNSIATVVGYIGYIVATVMALSYLGLSLDKIAIVAGALSVGIGFGLQSIVNNFVSGLILLWERPIKVGDLITVGADQGRVRRINVRSTEIETPDRSSLIVPNSDFILSRVKNATHSNRQSRIRIPLVVALKTDPEAARALLLDAANAHRDVLSVPSPKVELLTLTAGALEFELQCYTDIEIETVVRSDLLFDILRRMREAGITGPAPAATIEVGALKALLEAIVENRPAPKAG